MTTQRIPTSTVPSLLAVALVVGCSGGPSPGESVTRDHFFPAEPDLPLVQYVRSYNGSPDFEERSRFLDYLGGKDDSLTYEISKAFSVATWKGRIYVTDSFGLQGLNVFDLENRKFFVLGRSMGSDGLKKPINVFVDDAGYKFVSDSLRKQVVVFGPNDEYVRSYGDGRSFTPVACVAFGSEVFVLDMQKDRVRDPLEEAPETEEEAWDEIRRDQIVVLDRESGKPLRRIGRHGVGQDGFSFASFLAVDRVGQLYVSDFMNHRLVKLDAQGNVLAEFGRHGDRAGDFAQMKGVAVDREGLIYVVDAAFQAVQVFDNGGRPLFALGGPQAPQGPMDLPGGIWIDYHNLEYLRDYVHPDFEPEYLVIVANQLSRQHRVAVYAYGRMRGVEYAPPEGVLTIDTASREVLWKLDILPGAPPTAEALTAPGTSDVTPPGSL